MITATAYDRIAAREPVGAHLATCTRTLWEVRMPEIKDITGQRFGRLVAIERAGWIGREAAWRCRCDCGGERVIRVSERRRAKSCGCLRVEHIVALDRARATHGMTRTPEFRAWQMAKDRCLNPRNKYFSRYAPLGFHDGWVDDFMAFYEHIGPRQDSGLSLERKDNEHGYFPGNVKWATRKEQSNNRRPRKLRGTK